MGAWDSTSFGNDTAGDWADALERGADLSYIEATLQAVLDMGDEYIESDLACEAIAAAEVVAWLNGHPTPVDAYTEKVAAWVTAHQQQPSSALKEKALSVLDRVERQPSELAELSEGSDDWTDSLNNLRTRLTT